MPIALPYNKIYVNSSVFSDNKTDVSSFILMSIQKQSKGFINFAGLSFIEIVWLHNLDTVSRFKYHMCSTIIVLRKHMPEVASKLFCSVKANVILLHCLIRSKTNENVTFERYFCNLYNIIVFYMLLG